MQTFDERFADLIHEDVGLMDIYSQLAADFELDHPEIPKRFSRMLVRGALNRAYITEQVRREMETYYRTGAWRKRDE